MVRCTPPASARPGARALIRADGSLEGWVGGSCAQPLVVREALEALRDGRARLVRLSPAAVPGSRSSPDVVEYLMTCHSGGTLEIFIEPLLPAPQLWVLGGAPVCRALAAMGRLLGYEVVAVDPDPHASPMPEADVVVSPFEPGCIRRGDRAYVVVATMGTADEELLEAALRSQAGYVALVASRRRAAALRDYLAERGVSPEQLARLKAPAGLDIGAQTPQEIALSILAEITRARSTSMVESARAGSAPRLPAGAAAAPDSERGTRSPERGTPNAELRTRKVELGARNSERGFTAATPPAEATDPVCGMSVSTHDARYLTEHAGQTYYFCCARCKASFEAEPAAYAPAAG